ncbi:MAG: CapA family protein [Polyangiaceae bacterium]|nr:CapA family protein [Polyangiaceae bacterium]
MEPGFPFAGVKERLSAADVAIGNLECVVSTKGTLSTWHKPFRSPLIGIDVIKSAGIDAVSVANNHSWDFGADGFYDMLQNLDAKNLPVLGRGYRQELAHEPEKPWKVEIRGTKIAFLGFYLETDDKLKRDVEAAKKEADLVVAYFHWGREKQSEATPEQKRQARVVIDAGGDLVVGSHVHVLQPTEMYKGKLIAYGLGNFVFMGMNTEERFRRGAILEVELSKETLFGFELVSTRVDDKGAPRIVVPENSYLPDAPKTSKP